MLVLHIDSILSQTYDNTEIILVNDGSSDNSDYVCRNAEETYDRIKYIHFSEDHGISYARNIGIEAADSEYLSFVYSDDWIEPEMFETLLNLLEKEGKEP